MTSKYDLAYEDIKYISKNNGWKTTGVMNNKYWQYIDLSVEIPDERAIFPIIIEDDLYSRMISQLNFIADEIRKEIDPEERVVPIIVALKDVNRKERKAVDIRGIPICRYENAPRLEQCFLKHA